MTAEPALFLATLVLALAAALLGAFVALRLGQSVVLGYIVAGVVIGPFTPGFVGDVETVRALADIGIVLLMFSIGVQVSFRDLLQVGRVALLGGNIQVLITIGLGYLVGVSLGWSPLEALFLGAIVSNSSSTVLTKALDERGELDSRHGRIALSWSSVQDLGTILLVVILSALATGKDGLLMDALLAFVTAGAFLLVLALFGSIAFPWLIVHIAALRNRELFVLTVAVVALGAAYLSTFFGLSLALGAFVAGVVVGECDFSDQILGELTPLRDVFAGLFFVSVGMLVDPVLVFENPLPVLVVTGLIVVAKGTLSTVITALFGYAPRTSLLAGVALAQSAEFSFLLASLGTDLGVLAPPSFSLILAAVAASMVISPILHHALADSTRRMERLPALGSLLAPINDGEVSVQEFRGHAVICGYGRVGRVVTGALLQRRFPVVVIDEDRRVVLRLRERGVPALLGNAANPRLLDRARVARARVLVVAIPDAPVARQVVDHARRSNPTLDIVVRTHSWAEREALVRRGVGEPVMGELELALEMTRHTLRRFGLDTLEAQAVVQRMRRQAVRLEAEEDDAEDQAA